MSTAAISLQNKTSAQKADLGWRNIYQAGGLAALLAILVALTDIFLTFLPAGAEPPGTLSSVEWFELFQDNWFFGLRNLGLLPNILILIVMIPLFLALYGAHEQVNKAYAALALILLTIGTAVYLSNNAAFPMWALSARYAAATTDAQRTLFAAAGEAILARGEDFTPGALTGFLLSETASFILSLVMLRGGIFSKATACTGILACLCLTTFTVWTTFSSAFFEAAMVLAMIGGLSNIAWYILTARRLFQLSRQAS